MFKTPQNYIDSKGKKNAMKMKKNRYHNKTICQIKCLEMTM